MITKTLLVASLLALSTTAYAQNRNINLEPECAATGSGMDPRCVGDTEPGTTSDMTTARQQRAMTGAGPIVEAGPRARMQREPN